MVSRSYIGHKFDPFRIEIERGQLLLFAKAIGETDALYTDEMAAREMGYPSILMPPTFPFCAMTSAQPITILTDLGVDWARILHGEQSFTYHAQVFAGDVLSGQSSIRDIYSKRDGELEFLVLDTEFFIDQELVCESTQTLIVRNQIDSAAH